MAYAFVTGAVGHDQTDDCDTTGSTVLFAGLSWAAAEDGDDVNDTYGNSYTQEAATDNNAAMCIYQSFEFPTVGSGHHFTAGITSDQGGVYLLAFSGGFAEAAMNNSANSGSSSPTSLQPGAVTPDQTDQIAISGFCVVPGPGDVGGNTGTFSVGSGFSTTNWQRAYFYQFEPPDGTPKYGGALSYLINPALSSLNPTWSWSPGRWSAAAIVVSDPPVSEDGEIKTRNEIVVNPVASRVFKARNGLAAVDIDKINELKVNGTSAPSFTEYSLTATSWTVTSPFTDEPIGYGQTAEATGSSISPTTFNGEDVIQITSPSEYTMSPPSTQTIVGIDALVDQDFFSSIDIDGTVFTTISADSYVQAGGQTFWLWLGAGALSAAGTYDVTIFD